MPRGRQTSRATKPEESTPVELETDETSVDELDSASASVESESASVEPESEETSESTDTDEDDASDDEDEATSEVDDDEDDEDDEDDTSSAPSSADASRAAKSEESTVVGHTHVRVRARNPLLRGAHLRGRPLNADGFELALADVPTGELAEFESEPLAIVELFTPEG